MLLNAAAGTLARSSDHNEDERIVAALAEGGIDADVRRVAGDELSDVAQQAAHGDADLVIAGGGDGTINAIACALVGSGKPLAILPLGTLNHLARELEVPTDIKAACAAIAAGSVQPFNVGEVNGRCFLSFSGIGVYAHVVKHRDAQRRALGRGKWVAMIAAMARVFRRFPVFRVLVTVDGRTMRRLTPLVFITLSEYQMDLFGVRNHGCHGRSALNLYVAAPVARLGLLWLIIKAALGLLRPEKDFEAMCLSSVQIDVPRRRSFRVAIDGEIIDLPAPLRYRLVEGGLMMVMPGRTDGPAGG